MRTDEHVLVPVATLKAIHRELDACQKVIWLAGGFDPAYCEGAQTQLKEIDDLLVAPAPEQQSECRCRRYGKDNPYWPCPVHSEQQEEAHALDDAEAARACDLEDRVESLNECGDGCRIVPLHTAPPAAPDVSWLIYLLGQAKSCVEYQRDLQNTNHEAGRGHYADFDRLVACIDAALSAHREKQGGDT